MTDQSRIQVKFINEKQILSALDKLPALVSEVARNRMGKELVRMHRDMVNSMANTPKDGKTYVRAGGAVHIASSPGNPPAIDTGRLSSSISIDDRWDDGDLSGEMAIGADSVQGFYAGYLEKGTTRMAARPFMQPILDAKTEPQMISKIISGIERSLLKTIK